VFRGTVVVFWWPEGRRACDIQVIRDIDTKTLV
jgi:hypothetical protein